MKRLALVAASTVSLTLGGTARAAAQGPAQPAPWTNYGSNFFATSSDVWVRFFGASASYTDDLFWICNLASSCQQLLFQDHTPSEVGEEVKLPESFAVGQQVFFKLFVASTGETYYSGPASRDPDDTRHFATETTHDVTPNATYTVLAGFEDTYKGGDKDYNDMMFEIANVSTTKVTATPEPASLGLMATGLLGLGGVIRRRRKSNE